MNKLEIFQEVYGSDYVFTETELIYLMRVAELVRQDEREACAVLCETECAQNDGITCAEEIRARGSEDGLR
jgi:hypothetical protein